MLSYTDWINANHATAAERTAVEESHAADTLQVIQDNPTSIAFKTAAGATLAAQTVRIDSDNSASDAESVAGAAPRRKIVITAAVDADIKEGYRFVLDGDQYRVVDIIPGTIGEVQAICEATG
jgi:hypothetical protein